MLSAPRIVPAPSQESKTDTVEKEDADGDVEMSETKEKRSAPHDGGSKKKVKVK